VYKNNHHHEMHGFLDVLKWKWQTLGQSPRVVDLPMGENDPEYLRKNGKEPTLTWIGHSSFLLQFDGYNILTDPHLTDRASPLSWIGPKRVMPPGLALDKLPEIDLVLISHNHYDHLDRPTILRLYEQQSPNPPQFMVPLGVKQWFENEGIHTVTELGWWDQTNYKKFKLTAVPAQHFSGRGLGDQNETLWAGWVLKSGSFSYYFAGDSGYSEDFKEIGRRLGPFDLSTIPIGAYEPRWFMEVVHVDPEEAVRIHQEVGSRFSVGMHWGTFLLADEDMDDPPRRLQKALKNHEISIDDFITLKHGETLKLDFLF